jgi:hypothetical protein
VFMMRTKCVLSVPSMLTSRRHSLQPMAKWYNHAIK